MTRPLVHVRPATKRRILRNALVLGGSVSLKSEVRGQPSWRTVSRLHALRRQRARHQGRVTK